MRQLLYASSSTSPVIGDALATILRQSRSNNAAHGLTGLLWTDGARFMQVLEGEDASLHATFARIVHDDRHRDVVVLHDRAVAARAFGRWAMALAEDSDERIAAALRDADPLVRGAFQGVIDARRAAA